MPPPPPTAGKSQVVVLVTAEMVIPKSRIPPDVPPGIPPCVPPGVPPGMPPVPVFESTAEESNGFLLGLASFRKFFAHETELVPDAAS